MVFAFLKKATYDSLLLLIVFDYFVKNVAYEDSYFKIRTKYDFSQKVEKKFLDAV